jgi:hypothetical protein
MVREYNGRSGNNDSVTYGAYGLVRRSKQGENVTTTGVDTGNSGTEIDLVNVPYAIPVDGAHTHTVVPNGTIGSTGGPSTYPTNISVYYFIKY